MHSSLIAIKIPALLLGVLILSSGLSCAVVPEATPQSVAPVKTMTNNANANLIQAYGSFEQRDFAAANNTFKSVVEDAGASNSERQLALLGQAMVHLSTDTEWRDISLATGALQSAEAIDAGSEQVASGLLVAALSSLMGVENNNSELNRKVANGASEIAKLKDQNDVLQGEQDMLNEALEKLKSLTIGN
jgi:hypothetical protein